MNDLNTYDITKHTIKISWFFYLNLFASLLLLLNAVVVHFALRDMAAEVTAWNFESFSEAKINAAILPDFIATMLRLVSMFVSVSALIWFYQLVAYGKAHHWTKYSPVLAVFSFFIPFVNIFLPCLIMNAIWKGMCRLTGAPYPWTIIKVWMLYLISVAMNLPMSMLILAEMMSTTHQTGQSLSQSFNAYQTTVTEFISADFFLILSQMINLAFILGIILIAQRLCKMFKMIGNAS